MSLTGTAQESVLELAKAENFTNKNFNFEIEAFQFIEVTNSIRIHCVLLVCEASSELQECTQECVRSGRKRRKIGDHVSSLGVIDVATTYDILYENTMLTMAGTSILSG